jgi:hypothetical protein
MCDRFVLLLLLLSTVVITPKSQSQLVQNGPSAPDFCEKVEHLTPNLRVTEIARISGTLVDDSGAPFKASRVELRNFISAKQQASVKIVTTDEHGRFDLGAVGPGQYRLLASATRAFAQPQTLACAVKACQFDIKLHVNPTDLPASVCPVH